MYTGIIDHQARIVDIQLLAAGIRLTIASEFQYLVLGESIAVDGICVTVTKIDGALFCCELSPETLRVTTARNFVVGTCVNLERSLRVGDRMGGHYVMGHVDQVMTLVHHELNDNFRELTFSSISPQADSYFIPKGSVAVNGVSLTINRCNQDAFTVMIIPHTAQCTNLGRLCVGNLVNIEYDWMVKTVVQQLMKRELLK